MTDFVTLFYKLNTRRKFINASLGTLCAATLSPFVCPLRQNATAQSIDPKNQLQTLEKNNVTIAHCADVSSSPLFVAKELGFDAGNGIKIETSNLESVAESLNQLKNQSVDAAILPATAPLLELSKQGEPSTEQLVTAFTMGLNAGALVISPTLYHNMAKADLEAMSAARPTRSSALLKLVSERKKGKKRPLRFGVPSRFDAQELMLRYWLADGGVDPEDGIEFLDMSNPLLLASLKAQAIDGFFATDPLCSYAIEKSFGYALVTSREIWSHAPTAALVVRLGWAEQNPNSHAALLRAVSQACSWSDLPGNRASLTAILSRESALNTPVRVLENSLIGDFTYINGLEPVTDPDFAVFNRYAATFPWRSDALWYLTQLTRWGYYNKAFDLRRVAQSVYRPDLFRHAVQGIDSAIPQIDFKTEGQNFTPYIFEETNNPFVMGVDTFIDGRQFNPSSLTSYLSGFEIDNLKVDLSLIRELNG